LDQSKALHNGFLREESVQVAARVQTHQERRAEGGGNERKGRKERKERKKREYFLDGEAQKTDFKPAQLNKREIRNFGSYGLNSNEHSIDSFYLFGHVHIVSYKTQQEIRDKE
jgi:hypothetical protein